MYLILSHGLRSFKLQLLRFKLTNLRNFAQAGAVAASTWMEAKMEPARHCHAWRSSPSRPYSSDSPAKRLPQIPAWQAWLKWITPGGPPIVPRAGSLGCNLMLATL